MKYDLRPRIKFLLPVIFHDLDLHALNTNQVQIQSLELSGTSFFLRNIVQMWCGKWQHLRFKSVTVNSIWFLMSSIFVYVLFRPKLAKVGNLKTEKGRREDDGVRVFSFLGVSDLDIRTFVWLMLYSLMCLAIFHSDSCRGPTMSWATATWTCNHMVYVYKKDSFFYVHKSYMITIARELGVMWNKRSEQVRPLFYHI